MRAPTIGDFASAHPILTVLSLLGITVQVGGALMTWMPKERLQAVAEKIKPTMSAEERAAPLFVPNPQDAAKPPRPGCVRNSDGSQTCG